MARTKTKREAVVDQPDLLTERPVQYISLETQPTPAALVLPVDFEPVSQTETALQDLEPFGAWLVKQHLHRREWVAGLARTAKADHRFPKRGSVDDVRKYLAGQGADGDAFAALDDAEMDWLTL